MSDLISSVAANQYKEIRNQADSRCKTNEYGMTATMLAAQTNKFDCIREIRALDLYETQKKKGARKFELRMQHHQTKHTALMLAAQSNFGRCAQLLLSEHGMYDYHGLCALAYALHNNSDQVISQLLPLEGDLYVNGLTMLQFCIMNDKPEYFNLFSDQRGRLSRSVKRNERLTPLMVAALSGRVQYLHIFSKELDIMDPNNRETVCTKVRKLIERNTAKGACTKASSGIFPKLSYCHDNAILLKILDILDQFGRDYAEESYPDAFFSQKQSV